MQEATLQAPDLSNLSVNALEQLLASKKAAEAQERDNRRRHYETLREETVETLTDTAIKISSTLQAFKEAAFDDLKALYDLLKEYSKRHQDGKGNFEVINADGTRKIIFKRQDNGHFDERSKQAEQHIISFVNKRFAQDDATRDLIMSLLERRKGHLDIKLVQKLYAMEDRFDDAEWKEGLRLLKESWHITDTCDYATFYTKDRNNRWELINLNFASL